MAPSTIEPAASRASGRAAPLPPAERREAIITAVLPLLIERGTSVTSKELAQAAGVAEGTIFKVFADKDDLFAAAWQRATDPAPFEEAVDAVDPALGFEERLVAVTELMQRRLLDIWRLIHQIGPIEGATKPDRIPDSEAMIAIFAAEPHRVRLDPRSAARQLRAIMLALSNPMLVDEPLGAREIVDTFLRGVVSDR